MKALLISSSRTVDSLNEKETDEHRQLFNKYDTNEDGIISLEEVKRKFDRIGYLNVKELLSKGLL